MSALIICRAGGSASYVTDPPVRPLTPLGEVDGLLVGLDRDGVGLLGGEAAADGASLLVAEVEGHVLRLLVELAQVLALLLVDDRKDARNRLADGVAAVSSAPLTIQWCALPSSFVHPSPLPLPVSHPQSTPKHAHLGELGRRATNDLLDAESSELSAELGELRKEVGLVLGGKLRSPDFLGGRHFLPVSATLGVRPSPSPSPIGRPWLARMLPFRPLSASADLVSRPRPHQRASGRPEFRFGSGLREDRARTGHTGGCGVTAAMAMATAMAGGGYALVRGCLRVADSPAERRHTQLWAADQTGSGSTLHRR